MQYGSGCALSAGLCGPDAMTLPGFCAAELYRDSADGQFRDSYAGSVISRPGFFESV